jgi:DNA-binding SARP family transcriptional activator
MLQDSYARRTVERCEPPPLGIQLLGAFAVRVGGSRVPEDAWRLRRAKSLIKLLALAPERRMHREQVTELLWPGREPTGNSLHQVLYTARRAVATDDRASDRLVLRLVALKDAFDPTNVFRLNQNIPPSRS